MEQSAVQFGGMRIAYTVRRSARRRTVAITVVLGGAVTVAAPPDVPLERLDRVVKGKARWVLQRLRGAEETEGRAAAREFVSGETCLYLGRHYRLRVITGSAPVHAGLTGRWLEVVLPSGGTLQSRAADVRAALVGWYVEHASLRLHERVAEYAARIGVDPPVVLLRDPPQRWGSCNTKGELRVNWRIIQAPMQLVDYVVAHELVHLRHRNHTPAYWAALGRVMPDYERRREELRRVGPGLVW